MQLGQLKKLKVQRVDSKKKYKNAIKQKRKNSLCTSKAKER